MRFVAMKKAYLIDFIGFMIAKAKNISHLFSMAYVDSGNRWIIYGNPADTIEGPIREERDPSILLKTEYKALLQVAGGNTRDLAIVMLFLQSGLRVSELVKLKLQDVDLA